MKLSEITPEKLRDIYYARYRVESAKFSGVNALVQEDVSIAGWRAVLDTLIAASDAEWAERYLAMRQVEQGISKDQIGKDDVWGS